MRKYYLGSLIAATASVYCLIANHNIMYDFLFLIPAAYAIGLFLFATALKGKKIYGVGLVFYIAQVLMYFRYVITPFCTVFSAKFTLWGWGPNPTNHSMLLAEILMCVEAWLILSVQYYAIRKFSKIRYLNKIRTYREGKYAENIWILVLYAIFACGLVLMVQPHMLIMEQYFTYTGSRSGINTVSMQGMYVVLSDTFKKVFLIIALIACKKQYDKRNNKIFLLLAIAAVAVNMALNTGDTRIRMVFAFVLGVYFLNDIFGKIPKMFYVAGAVLCVFSFISVSIVKFSYAIVGATNPVQSVLTIMFGQFQDYFAGPRLVGQMIELHKYYDGTISISTFFNDFLGSVPVISNFVDQTNRINYMFNLYCNMPNQSLIAPVLGIGYCYCPIFPFFFSMIFEYFVIKLDYSMTATNRITYRYLYAYMGYVCAMCMGYSTQNIYAQFISAFIPLLILFKINDKVRLRIKGNIGELKWKND